MGTYEGGVCRLNPGRRTWTIFKNNKNPAAGPLRNDVLCMREDRSGAIWFGTSGGISYIDPRTDKFFQYSTLQNDPTSFANVRSIRPAAGGGVWIGMNGEGVRRLDGQFKTAKIYTHRERDKGGLSSNQVLSVCEQHDGSLWVGTLGHGLNYRPPHGGEIRPLREQSRGCSFARREHRHQP